MSASATSSACRGTNELPLIDGRSTFGHVKQTNGSLPEPAPHENVDYVPCLHENIAVGAAMGYARGSGVPGVVELHITPGAAYGIGNLYNACKAHVVLCVQQHRDLLQEPLLESNSCRLRASSRHGPTRCARPGDLPLALQRAFKVAMTPPTQPVFLSIPWDVTIEHITPAADPSPQDYFFGSGGSLGFSMPASIGFSLAYSAEDDKRLVINVVGDGSALFYPQSWWTATHKGPRLDEAAGSADPDPDDRRQQQAVQDAAQGRRRLEKLLKWTPSTDTEYLHLKEDAVDYVALAAVFGVGGRRVEALADLKAVVETGIEKITKGQPYVLDVHTDPVSHEDDSGPLQVPRFYTLMRELHGDEVFDSPALGYFGPP